MTSSNNADDLRGRLLAHYRDRVTRSERIRLDWWPWPWPDGGARQLADDLEAGRPVVLAGWQLARFDVPVVRRGVHAFYRVEPDGVVVEVVARRDPADRRAIVGWDEVNRANGC